MGRSRGGLTTKVHAVVGANGNPVTLKLSEGQAHDGRSAADMLDSLKAHGNLNTEAADTLLSLLRYVDGTPGTRGTLESSSKSRIDDGRLQYDQLVFARLQRGRVLG